MVFGMSKCGFCGSLGRWELSTEEPNGSAFKINFIRCAACKVPVGVTGYYDVHSKIDRVEKLLKSFKDSATFSLSVLDENIRRLFRGR